MTEEDLEELRERHKNYEKYKTIFYKARSLIKAYGETDNIPWGQLKGSVSGFDEAYLLAAGMVVEEDNNKLIIIN